MFKTKLIIKKNEDKILTTDEFIQRQVLLARIRDRRRKILEKEKMEKRRPSKIILVFDEMEDDYE
jgi:hypothetical protein